MSFLMTVSPDFNAKNISGWFIFNTWLQRKLGENIHLELFDKFHELHEAIRENTVNLIYANPYNAAELVRAYGFRALVRPDSKADEALIAVKATSPISCIEDLRPGTTISSTDNPDVHMMCMIMLEPADLDASNVTMNIKDGYVVVAKDLLRGHADAGFFLAETYDALSDVIRKELRILVRSQIHVINHVFLVDKALAPRATEITGILTSMAESDNGQRILKEIGVNRWEAVDNEEVEFMIDLMSTLVS
jgi:phosphonate transport system substrate-binding protein